MQPLGIKKTLLGVRAFFGHYRQKNESFFRGRCPLVSHVEANKVHSQ